VQNWHPITKTAASLGLLGLVITWWTSDSSSDENLLTTAPAESVTSEMRSAIDTQPGVGVSVANRALPPLNAFETMISRPLFMPDRRPAEAELSLSAVPMPLIEPEPNGEVTAPDIRFIGSVEDSGTVRALISDGKNVRGLQVGQSIDGWEVIDIEPRRLKLAFSDHSLEMTILE
jgi:hypothetical protein